MRIVLNPSPRAPVEILASIFRLRAVCKYVGEEPVWRDRSFNGRQKTKRLSTKRQHKSARRHDASDPRQIERR
jgi:hypothetical protein